MIAKHLRVSVRSVERWRRAWREGGRQQFGARAGVGSAGDGPGLAVGDYLLDYRVVVAGQYGPANPDMTSRIFGTEF
ncbi:helix-turn-helix domain-containing protein [Streptomyces sp. NPDC101150]|uniref:helix-turn-helix domain-containing protein n=1 Tax=Streptomyces sp. NPDC101150 TaxID=3366114 RepID=UPI00382ED04C